MVIRRRNPGWQLDVVLPDGTRVRKQFPTKKAAAEYAAELDGTVAHPNPSKRVPMAKSRSLASSARSK